MNWEQITQGLRPGLCRSTALAGLLYVFPINMLYYFDALALYFYLNKTYYVF